MIDKFYPSGPVEVNSERVRLFLDAHSIHCWPRYYDVDLGADPLPVTFETEGSLIKADVGLDAQKWQREEELRRMIDAPVK